MIQVYNIPVGIVFVTLLLMQSTNIFKNILDIFWVNQEIKFDWHADNTGIGSQSVNN